MRLKKYTPCRREPYVTLEQRYAQLITTVYQYPIRDLLITRTQNPPLGASTVRGIGNDEVLRIPRQRGAGSGRVDGVGVFYRVSVSVP